MVKDLSAKTIKDAPVKLGVFENLWGESWTYIKTVVDATEEPLIILNKDLKVITANEPFYQTFHVIPEETENESVYLLGNGQWDIRSLRKLLEDIIDNGTFFKGFEVAHEFPFIGRRVMILNARQIFFKDVTNAELCPPIILLAIDDVTEMMDVAKMFAGNSDKLEAQFNDRARKLEVHIQNLEDKINALTKGTSNL